MAAGDLTTLASVREFLRQSDATQTDMDATLTTLITQASKAIHKFTGREFATTSSAGATRKFEYYGGGYLHFTPYDLKTCTTVTIDSETDSPTTLEEDADFFLKPRNKDAGVWEYMELRGLGPSSRSSSHDYKPWRQVSITGDWGFPAVPEDVKVAANMLVAFWYRNQSAVPGRELDGEGSRFGAVAWPTAVRQILAPYRIIGAGYGG